MNFTLFIITLLTHISTNLMYIIAVLKRISLFKEILFISIIGIILFLITKHLYSKNQNKILNFSFKNIFLVSLSTSIYEILYIAYSGMSKLILKQAENSETLFGKLPEDVVAQNIIEAKQRVAGMGAGLIIMTFMINFGVCIFLILKYRKSPISKNIETFIEKFNITNIKDIFKKDESKEDVPDIILAKDPKTNKPIKLPYKDRFLHMLILGPTGSGKTSQTIIPMINQDMQKKCGITVIEPKGDLAEKVWAMGEHYGRKVVYFNPMLEDCPYFNPLFGKEEEVVENMSTTFKMLNPDSPQFFLDQNDNLIRNALKVLKRLEAYGETDATFINLNRILYNTNGEGRKLVMKFMKSTKSIISEDEKKENNDIAGWFIDDYYKEKSKTYEHCSGLRSQVSKIISNKYLRRVLNPPGGVNDVNFDKHLEEGGIIAISTAQGDLRDLGKYLGYFIILQFQSAVFKRPGNENTRLAHFLYIDEFQEFSNPGFGMMLTQGRSYRVASHLATQNRDLMAMGGGRDGQNFVRLVDTNARNLVIYPGGNYGDADYYSRKFGEVHEITDRERTIARKGAIGLSTGIDRTVTTEETKKSRFSPTEIMYRPFGEITYSLIINNSIQPPGVGKIEYIPMDLNIKLDNMILDLKEGRVKQSIFNDSVNVETSTKEGVNYNISVNTSEKMDIPDNLFEVEKEIEDIDDEIEFEVGEFEFELDSDLDIDSGLTSESNNYSNPDTNRNTIDNTIETTSTSNALVIDSNDDDEDDDDLF